MSENSELYFALLRISAAQALRAAGLTTCRPSVLDTFADIFARYLMLLASTTRDFHEARGSTEPTISDVRAALEHVGLIRPLNLFNDPYGDDTRGVDDLIAWFKGPQAAEMRRVAGVGKEGEFELPGVGITAATTTLGPRVMNGSSAVIGLGSLSNMPKALLVGAKMGSENSVSGGGEAQVQAQASLQAPVMDEGMRDECQIKWFNDLKGKPERLRGTPLGPSVNGCRPITIEGGMIDLDLVKPQQEYQHLQLLEQEHYSPTAQEEQEEEGLLIQEDIQIKEESRSNSESLTPPPADMDLSLTPAPVLGEATQEN